MTQHRLERIAARTPVLILGYFAAHFLIRVALSSNLETDEAELVGHTFLALGYGNGHPPLYNWLVAGALALTGSWSAAVALVKAMLLAGTYLLAFDMMRRITGRALPGLMVVCAFLLLPQVAFKSQITLTHSVLVMFAVVATMHAVALIVRRGNLACFLWLGLAVTAGAMAKYNFLLSLGAILAAAASVPAIRERLFRWRMLLSAALATALLAPHAIWAIRHWRETTSRAYKMARDDAPIRIDIPFLGLDGLIDIAITSAAWAGPLLTAWFVIRAFTEPGDEAPQAPPVWRRFFGRVALIGVGAFSLFIAIGDKHAVFDRYLTPLLMPLPFWLALGWPLDRRPAAPLHLARTACGVAALMLTAWPGWVLVGREQLAYPYAAMASALSDAVRGPVALLSSQHKYAANLVLLMPEARLWSAADEPATVAVIWHEPTDTPPSRLSAAMKQAYTQTGATLVLDNPYTNFSGRRARLRVQLFSRNRHDDPPGAELSEKGTMKSTAR